MEGVVLYVESVLVKVFMLKLTTICGYQLMILT